MSNNPFLPRISISKPILKGRSKRARPHRIYPEERHAYTVRVGSLLEYEITEDLEESTPDVKGHKLQSKGADITIENLSIGIEVWNWSEAHSYEKRIRSVLKNLEPYQHKYVFCSFINKATRAIFEDKGNKVIEIGFQLLPGDYLSFYNDYLDTDNVKFYNKRTEKILRNIIKSTILKDIKDSCYVYSTQVNTVSTDYVHIRSEDNYIFEASIGFEVNETQATSLKEDIESRFSAPSSSMGINGKIINSSKLF
jgi:hypothetical protein